MTCANLMALGAEELGSRSHLVGNFIEIKVARKVREVRRVASNKGDLVSGDVSTRATTQRLVVIVDDLINCHQGDRSLRCVCPNARR